MLESLREIYQYRQLIGELVRRDLKLRYKNSVGGIVWSLLNPLMQIFVLTHVMKFIHQRPVKDYSAYLFIIFLWNFIQISIVDGCIAILQNAVLVRKVYFPRAILPLATLIGNLFHFSVSFVFTIVYFFVLQTYPQQLRAEFLMVIPAVFFSAVLCLGLSLILCYMNVFYEDVRFIVTAITNLLFFTLPIFFTVEQVRSKASELTYQLYMSNPITALLVTYQRALLGPPEVLDAAGNRLPPLWIPWGYFALACVTSTLVLIIGFALFERYKWEMVERL